MSDSGALAGVRVVVTRSRAQASRLTQKLGALGATVVEIPTIDIRLRVDGPLEAAARRLDDFDDVVLTSPNAVRALSEALERAGWSSGDRHPRIAAVGPSTAEAARTVGLDVAVVPDEDFVAESLVDALVGAGVAGRRVLYPRAADARDVVIDGLREAGAEVELVVAYEAVPAAGSRAPLAAAIEGGIDVVTVASSNTVRFLDALAGDELRARLQEVPLVSIGPVTSTTAVELGYPPVAEAEPSTLDGLVAAVQSFVATRRADAGLDADSPAS